MGNDGKRVTELELKILQQIWEHGGAVTVAEIVEHWPDQPKPGYTTILKTLQKMEQKAIVTHKRDGRKYLYSSLVSKEEASQNRLDSIIDRIFSSSRLSFAEYFVKSSDFTAEELERLKDLITQKEEERKC